MFGQAVGKSWYFESQVHEEAQNRLMYVAEQGEPFVLLLGERGLGKTTVLTRVQDECRRFGHSSVLINVAALDEEAFLWHLCGGLSVIPRESAARGELIAAIRDELIGRSVCNHRTVILLDDLNRAGDELTLMVQFLTAVNQQTYGGVTVIAAADGALAPGLYEASALNVRLSSFCTDDATEFVREALRSLDVSEDVVTPDGIRAIVEFCGGSPAQLNRICELLQVAHTTNPELAINADVLAVLTEETLVRANSA